jgi:uncharacterized surface protein with fasciclin (FAS1) repeats
MKPLALPALALLTLISCNKDLPEAEPITTKSPEGPTILQFLDDPNYSFLKAAITRAAPLASTNYTPLNVLLANPAGSYTFFAPNNAAFQASGIASTAVINAMTTTRLDSLLRYHLVGGYRLSLTNTSIQIGFPNLQLPTLLYLVRPLSLDPTSTIPPGLSIPIFPSKNNGLWVNNIPITQSDIIVANGIIHRTAAVVAPPSQFLWDRINTDTDLTYLKAAIQKADEGVAAASTLQAALQNPGASLTVFAPTNLAFQQLLTAQITAALMAPPTNLDQATAVAQASALASTPGVFTNPALAAVLTPTNVRGLVVYHLFGNRAFTVNLPVMGANVPTLLNSAIPTHPGVTVQATFGATGVTAATIKGAANSLPSAIQINPTPAPGGTSDQHYINGVLHKINQVLRPQ